MNSKATRSNIEDVSRSMYEKYSASSNLSSTTANSYLNNGDDSFLAEKDSSNILNNDYNTSSSLSHSVNQQRKNEGNGTLNIQVENENENLINSQKDLVTISFAANDNYDSLDDDYEPEEEPYDDEDYTFNCKNDSKGKKRKLTKKIPKQKQKATNKKSTIKKTRIFKQKIPRTQNLNVKKNSKNYTSSNNIRQLMTPNGYEIKQIFPPELLIQIFSNIIEFNSQNAIETLIKLSLVCEHWRKIIIETPILWSKVDLSLLANNQTIFDLFKRLQKENNLFKHVYHIDISNWDSESGKKILEFLTESSDKDLQSLSIKNCKNVSKSTLKIIFKNANNLRSLNISKITHSLKVHPFSTTVFKPLIERCGNKLKGLYMAENLVNSFPMCFSLILDYCTDLQVLDISNVTSMGSTCCISIQKFQQSCPNIQILRAANIFFHSSVNSHLYGWAKLKELSIPQYNVEYITSASHNDQILEQLTKISENLTLLDIRGTSCTTPRGLVKIPAWSLKHLSISNCKKMEDVSLGMVFQKWGSSLIDVDLSWNRSECCIDECVRSLCDVAKDEIKLKMIDLRGSAISFETLRQLILHCGDHLQTINLESCRSLPRGMKRQFQGADCQQLFQYILDGRCD